MEIISQSNSFNQVPGDADQINNGVATCSLNSSVWQNVRPSPGNTAPLKDLSALFEKAEALERRAELVVPESLENFLANLWWMIEQGVEEDLDALRRIKDNLPYTSEDIDELMKCAEQRILERVNDPDYVAQSGEVAYRMFRERWQKEYAAQFIAIHRRQVVASAPTEEELWPKLREARKERGPFRAYIIKVGMEMPTFRGPRVGLEKMRVRDSLSQR